MPENPYATPRLESEPPEPQTTSQAGGKSLLKILFTYVFSYLIGIILCILVTPADLSLAGKPIWFLYPFLGLIGCGLFYFDLTGPYLPYGGQGILFWLMYSVGLIPFLGEIFAFLIKDPRLGRWRPYWLATPVGFVGTLGVYYTAAASI